MHVSECYSLFMLTHTPVEQAQSGVTTQAPHVAAGIDLEKLAQFPAGGQCHTRRML